MSNDRANLVAQFYSDFTNKKKKKRKTASAIEPDLDFKEIVAQMGSIKDDYKSEDSAQRAPSEPDDESVHFSAIERELKKAGNIEEAYEDPNVTYSPPRSPIAYDTDWTHGKKGSGSKAKSKKPGAKKSKKKKKSKNNDDEAEEADDEAEEAEDDISVTTIRRPTVPSEAVSMFKSLTLAQIRIDNFKQNHNIVINREDELDLENTSCESDCDSEHESGLHRSRIEPSAVEDDDEFSVSRRRKSHADRVSEQELGDLTREFDEALLIDDKKRCEIRDKIRKRGTTLKKRHSEFDVVAGDMGRFHLCFMCAWGKRTYDVQEEHMEHLKRLMHENLGEIPLKYIALCMHAYYKSVIKPASEARGDMLPVWRSKHVYICITSHNQIPQIKLQHDLEVIEIIQGLLERKIAVIRQGTTDEMPVRHLLKELRETMALKWRLQALPMERMNYHRAERDIKLGGDRQYFRGLDLKKVGAHAGAPLAIGWKK